MSTRLKRMLNLFVIIAAMIIVNMHAYAASSDTSTKEIYIDGYRVTDEEIKVYVNTNQNDTSWINQDNTKIMFGSKELSNDNIALFSDNPEKITYKCLIDVSGSMSQARIDTAKEIINRIATLKRPEDNITITAMGNDLIKSEYMTDITQISDIVSQVKITKEDTNLYYAIVEELKELKTNDMVGPKKCLIIFSDGADDQATGITRDEATKAVTNSHIPVFSVALPKNKDNRNDQDMAKILGSFARISSGGVHYYTPNFSNDDLVGIGDSIVNTLNNSLIFTEDIRELDTEEKAHEFKVIVKTSEGNAQDVIDIAESDIKRIKEIQEQLQIEETPVEEPEEPEEPEAVEEVVEETVEPIEPIIEEDIEVKSNLIFGLQPLYFYIIIGLIILLIIIIITIIVLNRKKKVANNSENSNLGSYGNDDVGVTGDFSDLNGTTMALDDMDGSPTIGFEKPQTGKSYHFVMTRMGKGASDKDIYRFDLRDEYTIGRSASKSKLAISDDTALSGQHCTFYVKNNKIYLRDEKTTNGTFVNGVPITGSYAIENGDIIIIGSYEYRVTWT